MKKTYKLSTFEKIEKKEKVKEKAKKILGRDYHLPSTLKHRVIQCTADAPGETLLVQAGYTKQKHGWIRQINRKTRFHAYHYVNLIYLHRDTVVNKLHVADKGEEVLIERDRIMKLIPNKRRRGMVWAHNVEDALKEVEKLNREKFV